MKFYILTYQTIALIEAPKIHTDLLWDLTILFGGIALLYFTGIFIIKYRISRKSAKKSELKTELSPMISEFIFYDAAGSKEEKSIYINLKVKVRDMLKDDFKRNTISEILLELRKDVSGAAQQRLFELFQDLDLHSSSYKKLKSWRWENISSGIQELTRMEVHEAYGFLTKFVNDKRTTIRKQAEIAIVTLDAEGINYFLDTTRNKISEWQQLKLIEVLSTKKDFSPPGFKAWLVSKNKYVVLFALRLIKYYDQNNSSNAIIELVKHRDEQIKEEAIDCIKAFHLTNALPTLKQWFWNCTTDTKINILDTITVLGSPSDIPFLKGIEKKERNYSVTSKALGTINAILPGSILPTEGIINTDKISIPHDLIVEELSGQHLAPTSKNPKEEAAPIKNKLQIMADDDSNSVKLEKNPNAIISERNFEMITEKETDYQGKDINNIEVEYSTCIASLQNDRNTIKINDTSQIKNKIDEIEVVFEELCEIATSGINQKKNVGLNDIPVVVDIINLPLVDSDTAEVEWHKALNEHDVVFDQVVAINTDKMLAGEVRSEKNSNDTSVTLEIKQKLSEEKGKKIENIIVYFDEVVFDTPEIFLDANIPINTDEHVEVKFNIGKPPLRISNIEASELFEIEVEVKEVFAPKIELIEVVYEIVQSDDLKEDNELPAWLLNEITDENTNHNKKPHLKMEGQEWNSKESQMMDQIKNYINAMPPIENRNDEVSTTIQLLDDIELFGDEREILLLQELMQKENMQETKKRIDGLMKRFMGTDTYGKGLEGTSGYSVFEELFKNCDTESKLILLDEIVLIGDQKEVSFLEKLLNDPIEIIKNKAASSLKLLNQRFERIEIGQENEDADDYERFINIMELKPPKEPAEPSYFKIDFDIDTEAEEQEIKNEKQTNDDKGLFNIISNFFNKRDKQ